MRRACLSVFLSILLVSVNCGNLLQSLKSEQQPKTHLQGGSNNNNYRPSYPSNQQSIGSGTWFAINCAKSFGSAPMTWTVLNRNFNFNSWPEEPSTRSEFQRRARTYPTFSLNCVQFADLLCQGLNTYDKGRSVFNHYCRRQRQY